MMPLARHCERSEAIQWACAGSWIASSHSLLAMTTYEAEALPHRVIAGLDPAIHWKPRLAGICRPVTASPHVSMDHRVIGGAKRRRSSNGHARW